MPGTIIQDPTTGSLARVVDGKLRSICQTSLYAIAEGLLTGHSEFEQFGYNAAADSATTPNQPIDATMRGKLVILDTPATSITLWGVSASSVVWIAGNDA